MTRAEKIQVTERLLLELNNYRRGSAHYRSIWGNIIQLQDVETQEEETQEEEAQENEEFAGIRSRTFIIDDVPPVPVATDPLRDYVENTLIPSQTLQREPLETEPVELRGQPTATFRRKKLKNKTTKEIDAGFNKEDL